MGNACCKEEQSVGCKAAEETSAPLPIAAPVHDVPAGAVAVPITPKTGHQQAEVARASPETKPEAKPEHVTLSVLSPDDVKVAPLTMTELVDRPFPPASDVMSTSSSHAQQGQSLPPISEINAVLCDFAEQSTGAGSSSAAQDAYMVTMGSSSAIPTPLVGSTFNTNDPGSMSFPRGAGDAQRRLVAFGAASSSCAQPSSSSRLAGSTAGIHHGLHNGLQSAESGLSPGMISGSPSIVSSTSTSKTGKSTNVDNSMGAGTAALNAGFMFGAPRLKEEKTKRKKKSKPKLAKMSESGSSASGSQGKISSNAGGKTSSAADGATTSSTGTGTTPMDRQTVSTSTATMSDMANTSLTRSNLQQGSSGLAISHSKPVAGSQGSGGGALDQAGIGTKGQAEQEEEESSGDENRPSMDEAGDSSGHLTILEPPAGSDVENVLTLVCNIFTLPVAMVAAYRSNNIFLKSGALKLTDDGDWRTSLAEWSLDGCTELQDVVIIDDASKDQQSKLRYCVVHEPRVLFFMASPLRSSKGELLGTLCMADFKPRMLDMANLLVINSLQSLVIKQLERDLSLAQERADAQQATEKLQQDMMRALDHFEKCIMFVDTSDKGWTVLYTNLAWERITGIPREHVMNKAMQEAFQGRTAAPYQWAQWDTMLDTREEFIVDNVAVRQKPDKHVRLHLRLANNNGAAEGVLGTGLPDFIKLRGNSDSNYFVMVEEEVVIAGNVYEALNKHMEKVPGLELSHVLGKGGFGSVYYGTWNEQPVAVKMIENKFAKTNNEGINIEALMGQELSHPNIVKTIRYVQRVPKGSSQAVTHSSAGPDHTRSPSRSSKSPIITSAQPTSLQPGLHTMTSAQMAAAEQLTSASGLQHAALMGLTSPMTSGHPGYNSGGALRSPRQSPPPSSGARPPAASPSKGSPKLSPRKAPDAARGAGAPRKPSSSMVSSSNNSSSTDSTVMGGGDEPLPALLAANGMALAAPDIPRTRSRDAMDLSGGSGPGAQMQTFNSRNKLHPGGLSPVPELQIANADPRGPSGAARALGTMGVTPGYLATITSAAFSVDGMDMTSRESIVETNSNTHNNKSSATGSEDQGEIWIIMEYCDRGSLQDGLDQAFLKLRNANGEPVAETNLPQMVVTAYEIASALSYLHERGIVHGDLTAWNVMLTTAPDAEDRTNRGYTAKVADFGLSRTMDVKSKIKTRTYGTITHMPPETLISGIISKAADVFSFGVLMWQMYTGMKPWAGMNHGQIIYNVGMKNVQLLFPAGTPPAISDLSSQCTLTDPSKRPSFREVLERLSNMKMALGI